MNRSTMTRVTEHRNSTKNKILYRLLGGIVGFSLMAYITPQLDIPSLLQVLITLGGAVLGIGLGNYLSYRDRGELE